MTDEEVSLNWLSFGEYRGMGSHPLGDDMARLLGTINEHTMLTCSRNAVACLDLAQISITF
jgi:hypothetical protein